MMRPDSSQAACRPGQPPRRRPALAALAGLAVLTGALCGCASVAAWERGTLAKPQMATDALPLQRVLRAHVQASREAGLPEGSAGGGGCGCY